MKINFMKKKLIDLMRPGEEYELLSKQRVVDGKAFYNKYKEQFIDIACPSCDENGKSAFSKYGFNHKICKKCNTLYCSPRPNEDLLKLFYNEWDSPKMWTKVLLSSDSERNLFQYQPRVDELIKLMKNNNSKGGGIAIDIGAGAGTFALCLKNSKYFSNVIALDLSDDCVKICKKIGLEAEAKTVNQLSNDFCDLICVNDLVEHLYDPYLFFINCHKALRDNGYIFITTPNGQGFDFKIMKDKTINISPPEHIQYFNPQSIELILNRAGFKIISLETPGKLDTQIVLKEKLRSFNVVENNEYIDYLLEQEETVLNDFQNFLSKNKLSSHMLCLAQKI
mgnify:FL=1